MPLYLSLTTLFCVFAVNIRRTLIKTQHAFYTTRKSTEALHLQKQLKVVSKGVDRLEDDDTAAAVSMEIWLDLINNNKLEPQKDNSNMI